MNWKTFFRTNLEIMHPYAPGLRGSEVREKTHCDDVLKISSNENPYPPFPRALEAGAQILQHLNRYPDGSSRDLRKRLSEKYNVSAENIIVGNGSNELLIQIAESCLVPGDEVVYCWPSFVVYRIGCQLMGATPIELPLDAQGSFDLDAVLTAITEKTKIIFLCNPNNPSGNIYTKDAFDAFMTQVPDHVLVCVDEAYAEYCTDERYESAIKHFDGKRPLVILRTFSKIYSLAGARVGFAFAPVELVEALDKIREPFNTNTVGQAMAYYSLDDDAELDRRIQENHQARTLFSQALISWGLNFVPSHTNFVFVYFKNPQEVFEALLEQGIIVRNFAHASALRIGIGTLEDTGRLIDAFEKLREQGIIS